MADISEKTSEQKEGGKSGKGKPPGFKPGAHKVHVATSLESVGSAYGNVSLDQEIAVQLGRLFAQLTHPMHVREMPSEAMNRAVWGEACIRLTSFLMFKQLATAYRGLWSSAYAHYGRTAATEVSVPTGLIPLFKMYGSIDEDGERYDVSGQPFLAATMLLRAIGLPVEVYNGVAQQVSVETSLCLDLRQTDCFQHMLSWCIGVVGIYATHNAITLAADGYDPMVVEGFSVRGGFALFALFLNNQPLPTPVATAIRLAVICEANIRAGIPAQGLALPVVQQLNALGVVVIDWSGSMLRDRVNAFLVGTVMPMESTMDANFPMAVLGSMSKTGIKGQLVNQQMHRGALTDSKMGSSDLEMGAMMGTPYTGNYGKVMFYRIVADKTNTEMILGWFRTMKKKQERA